MSAHESEKPFVSVTWWTSDRVRLAGIFAIIGGLLLFARIVVGAYYEVRLLPFPWDDAGSPAYYVSEGLLTVTWAFLFAGFAALRARLAGDGGRLWRAGILLAMAGTAIAAIGFVVVTVAPVIDEAIVDPGNLLIGLGAVLLPGLGTFLMGIGLFRMNALSRLVSVLLILHFPWGFTITAVNELYLGQHYGVSILIILPFCLAVVLVGNYLRSGCT